MNGMYGVMVEGAGRSDKGKGVRCGRIVPLV